MYWPMATRDSPLDSKRATSIRFAVPKRRLHSNTAGRCQLAAVPSEVNPTTWLYSVGDEGLADDGLPISSLITTGYDDNMFVYQWQGNENLEFLILSRCV